MSPARFWISFKEDQIISNESNQGPWGGRRYIHWKSEIDNDFDTQTIMDFAIENGWILSKINSYSKDEISKWVCFNKPIFPLSNSGFSDMYSVLNINTCKDFPRVIDEDLTILSFNSGWVSIVPGTNESTETNGFIVVNSKRNKMSVYHLWGE
ncbi:MAG: hypothetical protein JXR03_18860 [Cyclobacteriaceae bacterium]